MSLPSKLYDVLKWITMIVCPALATLYLALAGFWGLPAPEAVAGTITAIATFLGACLKISNANYSGDGTLNIDTSDPDKDIYQLVLSDDVSFDDLANKKSVTFKVNTAE